MTVKGFMLKKAFKVRVATILKYFKVVIDRKREER